MTAEPLPSARVAAALREMSTDVRVAVLVDPDGRPAGEDEHAAELAALTAELFAAVDDAVRHGHESSLPEQVEAHTERGSVFAVRRDGWALAAVARRSALPSLAFYDLRTTLERVERR